MRAAARECATLMPLLLLLALTVSLLSCTALPPPQEWLRLSRSGGAGDERVMPPPIPVARLNADRLSAREILEIARQNNPSVAAALVRIRSAEALVAEARSLALPRLDGRGSYVRFIEAASFRGRSGSDFSGSSTRTRFVTGRGSDIYSTGVDFSYPVFDGGSAYYARESALASLEASRHDAEQIMSELDLQVAAAFLNILLAREATRIAEDALEFTESQVRYSRAREDAGEGPKIDRLRFETRASEEKIALNSARAQSRVRIAILAELLGVGLDEDLEFVEPRGELEFPDTDLVTLGLERRPEIRALQSRLTGARQDLEREQASWLPRLDFFASYGVLSLDDFELDQTKDELLVGSNVSWNLFEGGGTMARTAGFRHRIEELGDLRQELALQIEREVRAAMIDLEVARENMAESSKTMELAKEVLDRIAAQYTAGEAEVIDVTEAQFQRTRTQLEHVRSRVSFYLAQVRLRRATGMKVLDDEDTASTDE